MRTDPMCSIGRVTPDLHRRSRSSGHSEPVVCCCLLLKNSATTDAQAAAAGPGLVRLVSRTICIASFVVVGPAVPVASRQCETDAMASAVCISHPTDSRGHPYTVRRPETVGSCSKSSGRRLRYPTIRAPVREPVHDQRLRLQQRCGQGSSINGSPACRIGLPIRVRAAAWGTGQSTCTVRSPRRYSVPSWAILAAPGQALAALDARVQI
ncbi:hypothetical protein MSAN_02121200 [Mycena sanguinolenta]|uniref:Uncharacterized protein n=1 Tax=Mycena sanguinolenta TaxID=230812 RepID=A0A8H7CM88_9AGAR|nr:hypothetical protein MSAN_02121200 [Mycena sanguinolenta]